jgi:predicted DNA-binding transcriptional regulator AlpA
MVFPGHINVQELSKLSGLSVATLYTYRSRALGSLPRPSLTIGPTKFWKRKAALKWINERKKRKAAYL